MIDFVEYCERCGTNDRVEGSKLCSGCTSVSAGKEIVLDRDTVSSLLTYTEGEVETRIACLKDTQGQDRTDLEKEIEEGQELLSAVRNELKQQRHSPKPSIRHPILEMGDKIVYVTEVTTKEDAVLMADTTLGNILRGLNSQYETLVKHLNQHYQWD